MKPKSTALTFVYALAALLLGVVLLVFALKLAVGIFVFVLPVLWLLLVIAGVVSVISSKKRGNTKLLWLVIILLAPLFGSLLWFIWGKANT
jgi:hypothetical protein